MKTDLLVVGGGITGLSTAYIASKSNLNVVVLEASKKFGGLLNTFNIGDNYLEHYYHHFFTHDKEINWLIKELNLEDRLIYKKTTMGVFCQNKIYEFNNINDLFKFKPLSFLSKISFGVTSFFLGRFANWEKYEKTSTVKWFYRFAGKNVTQSLWSPLLKIKFGPYYDKVPLSWMIGRLRQRMNSRKKGDEFLGYLNGSLKVLLEALMLSLKDNGVTLISNAKVDTLIISNNSILGVKFKNKKIYSNKTIFTIPSIYLTDLISPFDKILSKKISKIKYFGAICLILELNEKLSDIYWLNISDEGFPFGGIIEHTNFIDKKYYKNNNVVYLSRYFSQDEEIGKMNNEQINDLMISALMKIFPNFKESSIKKSHIFKSHTAATVCDLNFSEKVVNCKTSIQNLYIANMMHIYPDERSVNNSIRVALEACNKMDIKQDYIPKGNSLSGKIGF